MNYIIWAKSASLYLCEKGKMGYKDGRIYKPDVSNNAYNEWEINNKNVMSWQLNSMNPEIIEEFTFLDSVKEI